MATTQCCICGRKLGRFDKSEPLSPSAPDALVCYDCKNNLDYIKLPAISDDNPMSKRQQRTAVLKIAEAISSGKVDEAASNVILDELVHETLADDLKSHTRNKKESALKAEEAELRYREERNNVLTTTAYQFEGYRITDYHGVHSGDCVIGTGVPTDLKAAFSDLTGITSDALVDKIEGAKSMATQRLIKKAIVAGGNAIIAIQYNVYPYGSMVGVTISGTSVTIEKE